MSVDADPNGAVVRQLRKQRSNPGYIHKKKPKRAKHLPAVTLNAVRCPGNPDHPNAGVSLRYNETRGVSVFVAGASVRTTTFPSIQGRKH